MGANNDAKGAMRWEELQGNRESVLYFPLNALAPVGLVSSEEHFLSDDDFEQGKWFWTAGPEAEGIHGVCDTEAEAKAAVERAVIAAYRRSRKA